MQISRQLDIDTLIRIIGKEPALAPVFFSNSGWQLDRDGYEVLSKSMQFPVENAEYSEDSEGQDQSPVQHQHMVTAGALFTIICHDQYWGMFTKGVIKSPDIQNEKGEILLYALFHPEHVATIVNYEHNWRLVTSITRGKRLIDAYNASFHVEGEIESRFRMIQCQGDVSSKQSADDSQSIPAHTHWFVIYDPETPEQSRLIQFQSEQHIAVNPKPQPFSDFIDSLDI